MMAQRRAGGCETRWRHGPSCTHQLLGTRLRQPSDAHPAASSVMRSSAPLQSGRDRARDSGGAVRLAGARARATPSTFPWLAVSGGCGSA